MNSTSLRIAHRPARTVRPNAETSRSAGAAGGSSERRAGIVFTEPLEFAELAEWVGKRLEVASLKASYSHK